MRRSIVGEPTKYHEQELKQEFRLLLEKKLLKMQAKNYPFVFKDTRTKQTIRDPLSIRQIVDDLVDNRTQLLIGSKDMSNYRRRKARVEGISSGLPGIDDMASF